MAIKLGIDDFLKKMGIKIDFMGMSDIEILLPIILAFISGQVKITNNPQTGGGCFPNDNKKDKTWDEILSKLPIPTSDQTGTIQKGLEGADDVMKKVSTGDIEGAIKSGANTAKKVLDDIFKGGNPIIFK